MEEVWSAAFKRGNKQMFQFPTWRTGSADIKAAKCLFKIVTALWLFLPPPTLNLLPWSRTVWIRAVKAALWSVSWEPSTCKAQGGAFSLCFCSSLPSTFFLSCSWKFRCNMERSWDRLTAQSREERQRFVVCLFVLFQFSAFCVRNVLVCF